MKLVRRIARWLFVQRRGPEILVGTDVLDRNWTFTPSRPDLRTVLERRRLRPNLVAAPPHQALVPIRPMPKWALFFIYAPDGTLTAAHRFSLQRLRAEGIGLAVVCAAPSPDRVPPELRDSTDALYWKGLSGFDFSAYALGLGELARHSPDADILVVNDSVYGPFRPLEELFAASRWDLTGFTASGSVQNHIQSYAFLLREWTARKLEDLAAILPQNRAYDDYREVVFCQETLFAETAARTMSVGALWYADYGICPDPMIFAARGLVEAGFPFLKRSLFTKFAHFQRPTELVEVLDAASHAVPE